MGEIERKVRANIRRTRINSAIIKTLAGAGVLAMALMAPNALQVLKQFGVINPQKKQSVKRSLARLIERGYIKVEGNDSEQRAQLTSKGEKYAALLGEGKLAIKRPKRWDGKWRMLMFDISERHKSKREFVRITLVDLGFHRLQDSVWVHPYDCEDIITLFKIEYGLGKDVVYVVADVIENDLSLRKHFGLTKDQ